MPTIVVNKIINNKKITKISNGVNIFNAMKSAYNKNKEIDGFILDMTGISSVKTYVFIEIIKQMQSRLNGQYRLELVNANQFVAQAFRAAFK